MELSKEQLIELYDIIFPDSLEDDEDIKANDMKEVWEDIESFIVWKMSDLEKIFKWLIQNGIWTY